MAMAMATFENPAVESSQQSMSASMEQENWFDPKEESDFEHEEPEEVAVYVNNRMDEKLNLLTNCRTHDKSVASSDSCHETISPRRKAEQQLEKPTLFGGKIQKFYCEKLKANLFVQGYLRSEPSGNIFKVVSLVNYQEYELKAFVLEGISKRERYNRLRSLKRLQASPRFVTSLESLDTKCITILYTPDSEVSNVSTIYQHLEEDLMSIENVPESHNTKNQKSEKKVERAKGKQREKRQRDRRKIATIWYESEECCLHCRIRVWQKNSGQIASGCVYCSEWRESPLFLEHEFSMAVCHKEESQLGKHCSSIADEICEAHTPRE
jgi:hypothetical protein